ncbi:MAG: C25 family cysteine peptidase, partial [Acidobacteriota bacterium]|nr:C25 family cysteine peptidase [Acidobacteriota bacterium]
LSPVSGTAAAIKIGVRADGVYRIDPAAIGALLALPAQDVASRIASHGFALTNHGQPIAWTADGSGGVLFYGQAVHSLYTLDNVYWLYLGNGAQMGKAAGGTPPSAASPGAGFTSTSHAEQETFAATVVPADPSSDYWYWDYLIAGDPSAGTKAFPLVIPNVNARGGELTVHLKGATDSQHHLQIRLDGVALGEASWSGIADHSASFAVPGFAPSGNGTVEMTALLDPGTGSSIVYVQSIDATYQRSFIAADDQLAFRPSAHGPVSPVPPLSVSGFSGPGVRVFDITHPRLPALLSGGLIDADAAGTRVTLVPSSPATRYFAAGPTALRSPQWLQTVVGGGLRTKPGGADYLILTTRELAAEAAALAALRTAQGLRTAIVDVADVMDDFSDGIPNPEAVRSFLGYVRGHWNPIPRYVVLAGSGNFDYRNLLGFGANLVPPALVRTDFGLFASDNHLADTTGRGLPDFAVGRIPAVSAAELKAYVDKLAAYEATPGADWSGRALLLADQPGPNDGVADFGADSRVLAASLPAGYLGEQIAVGQDGIAAARSALFARLATGTGLVNYFGHGGLDRLSSESVLTSEDAAALANGPRLPVVAALTCNVNRFDVPGFSSLGEVLARQPAGGAIAVWSASGLSLHPESKELARLFYLALANPANTRLGDAIQEALTRLATEPGMKTALDLYTLLGDPALQLKPVGPPAGGATGPPSTVRE